MRILRPNLSSFPASAVAMFPSPAARPCCRISCRNRCIFRQTYPEVTFSVHLRDREAAETALQDNSADLAIVLEPINLSVFENALSVAQPIWCLMRDTHPLAASPTVRLSDCRQYPVALPETSYGVRYLIDRALMRGSNNLNMVIEADSFEFLRGLPCMRT